MADLKDTELVAATPALADIITFVDISEPTVDKNKRCTIAEFLVAMRIRTGETASDSVTADTLKAFVFNADIGTAVDGSDYDLIITCVDALNMTTQIGYTVTSRTETGFEITPIADAYITYTAILK